LTFRLTLKRSYLVPFRLSHSVHLTSLPYGRLCFANRMPDNGTYFIVTILQQLPFFTLKSPNSIPQLLHISIIIFTSIKPAPIERGITFFTIRRKSISHYSSSFLPIAYILQNSWWACNKPQSISSSYSTGGVSKPHSQKAVYFIPLPPLQV